MSRLFSNTFSNILVEQKTNLPVKKQTKKIVINKSTTDNSNAERVVKESFQPLPKSKFASTVKMSLYNENFLPLEALHKQAPAPATPDDSGDIDSWKKSLDQNTNPSDFDGAENPALKLDSEGVQKAKQWIKKLEDMAQFINGTESDSLNSQINALEMRNSIPFKGVVRREEKRITKIAENLRGLAEVFKSVVIGSQKKIHDATAR